MPELLKLSFEITGISRKSQNPTKGVRWLKGDLTDPVFIARALEGCSVVVNAAGKTPPYELVSSHEEYFCINHYAAATLARLASGEGIECFIQVSSTGVFGSGIGEYNEDSPCNPSNIYEQSKLQGETEVLNEASTSMKVIVVRPTNVFGERDPRNKLLTWLRNVRKGRAVIIKPADKHWVNYVYVGDVARVIATFAFENSVHENNNSSAIYNINTPTTVQDFFNTSAQAAEVAATVRSLPKFPVDVCAKMLDNISTLTRYSFPLTSAKVLELTNKQIFAVERLKRAQPDFPYFGLAEGMMRLSRYYRDRSLL